MQLVSVGATNIPTNPHGPVTRDRHPIFVYPILSLHAENQAFSSNFRSNGSLDPSYAPLITRSDFFGVRRWLASSRIRSQNE